VLEDVNGGILAGLWPGELKPHAKYLYSNHRAEEFVSAASEGGWSVHPNAHIAFFQAPSHQRLYLDPVMNLRQYVDLWEGPGWERIGGYPVTGIKPVVPGKGSSRTRSAEGRPRSLRSR
jgi:hypothetical protein